jgi:hypothetical protein
MGFSNLRKGRQLITYIQKYNEWEDLEPGAKQQKYEGLNVNRFTYTKQTVYVAPFNVAGFDFFVEAKAPATGQNQPTPLLLTLATGRFRTEAPTTAGVTVVTNNQLFSPGKLAKLTAKQRIQTATQKSASRITTARYYRHQTNSASTPFGKSGATDTFAAALTAIRGNAAYDNFLDAAQGGKGNAISVKPEAA